MHLRNLIASSATALSVVALSVLPAMAASTVVVTPNNTQGWSTADTRPGGAVNFVADATAPAGTAALQLSTINDPAAKAQYMHGTSTPIANIIELSYYTKQVSAPFAQADASYQLPVLLNGNNGGFTTFVFEPYENVSQGVVVNGTWQSWNVAAGQFWSSKTVTCTSTGQVIMAGFGGAPFYSLSDIQAKCPEAIAVGFGVNVGSNNPGWTMETDLVSFNGTAYDFELANPPTSKDDCKKDGYKNLTDANGNLFKNQGQCVSYFNHQ